MDTSAFATVGEGSRFVVARFIGRMKERVKTMELVVKTVVSAPREVVFDVVQNIKDYPRLFAYVKDIKVISASNHRAVAEILEDFFGFHYWVKVKFSFQPYERIDVQQLSGPLISADGWFEFNEVADGTELIHGAEIHATGFAGLIGKLVMRSGEAKRRLVKEVAAIKRAAEERVSTVRLRKRNSKAKNRKE